MPLFDTYIIVDWSASRVPKIGRDSIWICRRRGGEETVINPPTRQAARALLAEMLEDATTGGKRVVAGFDFPFGYPAGFARRLGLIGLPWRAVWDEIASLIDDRDDNHNNRFSVAARLNERISGGAFPFWGCPAGEAGQFLGVRHHRGHTAEELLCERRLIDEWMVGAQPCWKLAYTGSVGSQALMGIPVVRALRDDPRWANLARIWPFETGLGLPDEARIVFAEVWPSWWKACVRFGPPNDKSQVRTVARIFQAADCADTLAGWFSPDIGNADPRVVVEEEAWTLGVTAPRLRAARKTSSPPPRAERLGEVGDSKGVRACPTDPPTRSASGSLLLPPMGGEGT